jgi:hypothetical protein
MPSTLPRVIQYRAKKTEKEINDIKGKRNQTIPMWWCYDLLLKNWNTPPENYFKHFQQKKKTKKPRKKQKHRINYQHTKISSFSVAKK